MTKCKDCAFFQPGDVDWNGWCSIELPRWLKVAMVHLPDVDNHFVRTDDGCDLGREKDCDEFQSDVQAAAGGLSQTPL